MANDDSPSASCERQIDDGARVTSGNEATLRNMLETIVADETVNNEFVGSVCESPRPAIALYRSNANKL